MLVDSNALWAFSSLERACSLEQCTGHSCAMLQATMIRMHSYNRQWDCSTTRSIRTRDASQRSLFTFHFCPLGESTIMVSLRNRSSRPSYAALPEGLSNLSEDSDDAGPSNPNVQALRSEGNMPSSSAQSDDGLDAPPQGSASDTDMSSGSDAYAPEAQDGRKRRKLGKRASGMMGSKSSIGKSQGKSVGKGKGKARAELSSDSGSDAFVPDEEAASSGEGDLSEGVAEEEDEGSDANDAVLYDDSDDALQTIDRPSRSGGMVSYPKNRYYKIKASHLHAATSASEDRAGLVDIPPAYRVAMESMAERMIKSSGHGQGQAGAFGTVVKTEEEVQAQAEDRALQPIERRTAKAHSKATRPVLSFLPRGTPLPWSSLLKPQSVVGAAGKPSGSNGTGKGKGKDKGSAEALPSTRIGEKVLFRVGESKMSRKWRNGRLAISAALGTPRTGFEGEGWYPEMYDPSSAPPDEDMGDEELDDDVDIDPRTGSMARGGRRKGRPRGPATEVLPDLPAAQPVGRDASSLRRRAKATERGTYGGMELEDDDAYEDGDGEGDEQGEEPEDNDDIRPGQLQEEVPPGWTLQGDVRLGLDDVGRMGLMDVELLSAR